MKLSEIITRLGSKVQILVDLEIEDIEIDSRLVKKNSAFFALRSRSKNSDIDNRKKFISDAIANGASVVVIGNDIDLKTIIHDKDKVIIITLPDPFLSLTNLLRIFYSPLPNNIYAITGTNGKTSTAEFTRQILEFLGKKSASIGTLGINCDDSTKHLIQNSSLTTPDIASLYKNLHILKKNEVDDVAIEVSSIGLEQERLAGLSINVAAFTNLTQDHLDYHQNMKEYFRCKMILFDSILENKSSAILNSDIKEFSEIKKICSAKNHRMIEYGFAANDLKLIEITETEIGQKISFELQRKKYQFELSISGKFQTYNALCALGNVIANYHLEASQLENLLQKFPLLKSANGRMQLVATLPNNAKIFIDFAHSPDALENVLQLARQLTKGRVVVLFGCGGNRDSSKRMLMGNVSCKFADLVIVTDDNPRHEDPKSIRKEILSGCTPSKTLEIADRKMAIATAIKSLQADDVLVLAGKGHEKYQSIGEQRIEFDEEKIVKSLL